MNVAPNGLMSVDLGCEFTVVDAEIEALDSSAQIRAKTTVSRRRCGEKASHLRVPAERHTFSPIPSAFLCMTLLACNVSVLASEDDPRDQLSDSTDLHLSFDGLGEPGVALALFSDMPATGQDAPLDEGDAATEGGGGADGSNPLAAVNKLDLYWTVTGAGPAKTHDLTAEGAFMLSPKLKLTYAVHYFYTDVTGSYEDDWESIHIKPIYFPLNKKLNDEWMMKVAVGAEYIQSFDNSEQGIGNDSNIIAPLFGIAFAKPSEGLTLIPLVQHFLSVEGPSVNTTGFRLIVIKSLPDGYWLKLDGKITVDWHHDTTPTDAEIEFGKMLNPNFGLFGKALVGVGSDRFFDWGVAAGVRFTF